MQRVRMSDEEGATAQERSRRVVVAKRPETSSQSKHKCQDSHSSLAGETLYAPQRGGLRVNTLRSGNVSSKHTEWRFLVEQNHTVCLVCRQPVLACT